MVKSQKIRNEIALPLVSGLVCVAAVFVVAIVLLVMQGVHSSPHKVTGTVTILDMRTGDQVDAAYPAGSCSGIGVHSSIGPGTEVTIVNGKGQHLVVAHLGRGVLDGTLTDALRSQAHRVGQEIHSCDFPFTAEVHEAGVYVVKVAGEPGAIHLNRDDLADDGWRIRITLG